MYKTALMTDIETGGLSTTPNAPNGVVILSIGSVFFDPTEPCQEPHKFTHTFYRNIDPRSCEAKGMVWDPSTVEWWKTQKAAKEDLLKDQVPIHEALTDWVRWLKTAPTGISEHWAKSPSFDYIVLQDAFHACKMRWPNELHFSKERDVRTRVADVYPEHESPNFYPEDGVAHNAMVDSIQQARAVQHANQLVYGLSNELFRYIRQTGDWKIYEDTARFVSEARERHTKNSK